MSGGSTNAMFYADKYHPIQSGSIDGTDVAPHDNAVLRALICSQAGLYDPFGDPKATGDPYCTVFVGRLSRQTDEETLRKAMNRYGRVKSMRLVRDIVTGASRGYAFLEYETDREMRRAYEATAYAWMDTKEARRRGWRKERIWSAAVWRRHIPYDELRKLGIPPPPEGRYMTRFQVPPPPRRESSNINREDSPPRRRSRDRVDYSSHRRQRSPSEDDGHRRKSSRDRREESESRSERSLSVTKEEIRYSRQRKETRDDDHKRRRSREPGEVSPPEEDGNYRREKTSPEAGQSPDQHRHHRHHRVQRHESSHSKRRDRRHHGHRGHSKRSESDDYSR